MVSWRENVVMKGVSVEYNGIIFKSKLEAKWACYFDCIGIKWQYEPNLFKFKNNIYYKPDFFLPQVNLWAEVKIDNELTTLEIEKIKCLINETGKRCILLNGGPKPITFELIQLDENGKLFRGNDCVVSMYHDYPIAEHRFYECSGFGAGYEASEYSQREIKFMDFVNNVRFINNAKIKIERARMMGFEGLL